MPVTTPSAPSPSPSQLASSASSVKEPSSTRRAMRSRTGSLPCSAALARWRSGPPARARSMASVNCSIWVMSAAKDAEDERREAQRDEDERPADQVEVVLRRLAQVVDDLD